MKYNYVAIAPGGKRAKGTLVAETETDALAQLRAQRLVPTALSQGGTFLGVEIAEGQKFWEVDIAPKDPHKAKIPVKRLILAFNQIAIMLRAGVNLSMALEVMVQSETHKIMKKILVEMHDDLLAGVALSDSMAKFRCFDSVTVNLVRAGEADGHLERSFAQVAAVQEKQSNLIAKVRSAAIYPCILLVLIVGVLILLNTMVLPSFIEMFEAMNTEMPAITKFVMQTSTWFTKWWWALALVGLAIVGAHIMAYRQLHSYRYALGKAVLCLPLVGPLVRHSQVARFSRIVATLLESGQDFLSSVQMGRSILTNQYIMDGLEQVCEDIRVGISVSAAMRSQAYLDPVYISMLRAGEESGSMGQTLSKMADLYEAETEESTKRITTAMEPLMTVLVSILVGFVVIAIALPMFSMFDLVGNV